MLYISLMQTTSCRPVMKSIIIIIITTIIAIVITIITRPNIS